MAALIGTACVIAAATIDGISGQSGAEPTPQCPVEYVVAIPGTWEPAAVAENNPDQGMLGAAVAGLPAGIVADIVAYPATGFPWETEVYGVSKRIARDRAAALIETMALRCPNTRIGLLGYSQGADAAGDLAAEIGAGGTAIDPARVVAVGLLSDPRRAADDPLVGPAVPGEGAAGPRIGGFGQLTPVVHTFCLTGDLYCATPTQDFVTRLAGFAVRISEADPARAQDYQREFGHLWDALLRSGGPQEVLQQQWAHNQQWVQRLSDFHASGVHLRYATEPVADGMTPVEWTRRHLLACAERPMS
ncbi:hypothetical protein BOX37_13495 [Nocardia mangyaensis]|uniref:Cutinase n=1 Tax=Nocardia mangyaensis TaxID=2213200 RepID=A0A1J0W272_9NOCA|nr:hypothetical protein BOX37_13495 [Nocardia mangyaensis]